MNEQRKIIIVTLCAFSICVSNTRKSASIPLLSRTNKKRKKKYSKHDRKYDAGQQIEKAKGKKAGKNKKNKKPRDGITVT